MTKSLEILLTNDDGIESAGFRALYEALSEVGNVTAVAPMSDQSAVGRSMSTEVAVHDHEFGYAIAGTPSDCVIAGLAELGPYPDVVVSGSNNGANLGAYVLGRSGTVSAAVEAAFFEVPAIAVSLHIPHDEWPRETTVEEHADAARATTFLVEHALDCGVFEQVDYINVNAPLPDHEPAAMEITRPTHVYNMDAVQDDGIVSLHDRTWEEMASGSIADPEGTDRRAIFEGRISVSPLTAPHTSEHHEALDRLAERFSS